MYDLLADFLKTFSVDHSLLWALLVMAIVATTSVLLYLIWALVEEVFLDTSHKKNRSGDRG